MASRNNPLANQIRDAARTAKDISWDVMTGRLDETTRFISLSNVFALIEANKSGESK